MKTIFLGALVALCASASVVTTMECEFADIETGAVLSRECISIYGAVTTETETYVNIDPGGQIMNIGILTGFNGLSPDYFESVSLNTVVGTRWSFQEQYVITGGTGTGTVHGTYRSNCDFYPDFSFLVVVRSMSAATNYAALSGVCRETFGNPFAYSFTFGEPITFFSVGEITLEMFRERNSYHGFRASASVTADVDGVFDSAGNPVDATFTLVPEPNTAGTGLILLLLAAAGTAARRTRRTLARRAAGSR